MTQVLSRYSEAYDHSGCFPAGGFGPEEVANRRIDLLVASLYQDIERQAGTSYAGLRAMSYRSNSNYPTTYLIKVG